MSRIYHCGAFGLLNVLRNVKHICLSFCQERSVINWQELPSSLQEALTRILMLPTLEGVRFVGITSIPQLLIKPLLRVSHCLTLEMAGFSTQSYDDQSGQQASISRVQNRSLKTLIIDKLKLEDVKPFVDALSSICNLKELRIWNAEGPFDDVEIATKIMHLQRNNITCIEFPLNYRVGDGVPALHIANLPNLRDLVLWPNFEEYYRNIQDADGLKTSLKILSTAQDGNCIDEILFIPQWPLFQRRWTHI
ncbi:hypothetical protein BDQ17DRAFT_1411380 [Cyathus striatus]|nr:hypothetical protein BDQ17DRAFT_1411380 [Cyathus striatus]